MYMRPHNDDRNRKSPLHSYAGPTRLGKKRFSRNVEALVYCANQTLRGGKEMKTVAMSGTFKNGRGRGREKGRKGGPGSEEGKRKARASHPQCLAELHGALYLRCQRRGITTGVLLLQFYWGVFRRRGAGATVCPHRQCFPPFLAPRFSPSQGRSWVTAELTNKQRARGLAKMPGSSPANSPGLWFPLAPSRACLLIIEHFTWQAPAPTVLKYTYLLRKACVIHSQ